MKKYLLYIVLFFTVVSCAIKRTIVEKPILFDAEREQLTLEYMKDRYGIETPTSTIAPKMVVLHWTVIPTLEGSYKAFYDAKLPNWRPDLENVSGLNVSSQFLVDQDGTIYQLLPETTMARHVIGLNHCAIGVENVGGAEDMPLTRKQLKSNIWLVKYLKEKYDIDYVIGHYEYTNFEDHELWLEKDASYRTAKSDPGERFMRKVRRATRKLEFKSVPKKINKK
ncbi:N-acetylmuramyl-L-alanine amidase, negative regulator of AmpC, AmpD [Cellulophaga algicola DSM 14237]|uniref:N-acetylmuramoyl-L-alanine amidase n=2 Tax=Cellulophaga TaxID=104264 RepID=E6XEM9_CELAD|nr:MULTISPECIES: peptidoglycan recognition family protein [Cellulophaga]ADV51357.1 N-acetylmuramyl-L-alanine amidase, negative regulator of AmpC, AmpD [Cellulophaga algicola DSM 14237]